jgi:hypothetical protein
LVWNSIVKLNEESHILKEKDKTKILQPINPNQSRSWKQRLNYLVKNIKGLEDKKNYIYEQFVSDEIDKNMLDKLNKNIKTQVSTNQTEIEELKSKLDLKLQKDGFINWVSKRQKRIQGMSKITDTASRIKIIKDFVDRIEMNHNKKINEFEVHIRLKLPLFNDKLVYTNVSDKSKGYMIQEGSYHNVEKLSLVSGRPKKIKEYDEITKGNRRKK